MRVRASLRLLLPTLRVREVCSRVLSACRCVLVCPRVSACVRVRNLVRPIGREQTVACVFRLV